MHHEGSLQWGFPLHQAVALRMVGRGHDMADFKMARVLAGELGLKLMTPVGDYFGRIAETGNPRRNEGRIDGSMSCDRVASGHRVNISTMVRI